MSFFHPVYIGHFAHDGEFAEPDFLPGKTFKRPKVAYPVNLQAVRQIAEDRELDLNNTASAIYRENGYLVIELTRASLNEIEFVRAMAAQFKCDLAAHLLRDISPNHLHL
jgi:hypothetical protein